MDLVPKEYKKNSDIVFTAKKNIKFGADSGNLNLPKISVSRISILKIGIIASAVLLALALAVWGGLKLYHRGIINSIKDYQKKEANIFSAQERETANKIIELERRAGMVQNFLKSHVYTSQALNLVADLTLPKVKWDSYALDVKERKITLKGWAADYSTLAKQIFVFQETEYLSKVVVSGIALDRNGMVGFGLDFKFDPKILQLKTQ